jgi:hypothetical protein
VSEIPIAESRKKDDIGVWRRDPDEIKRLITQIQKLRKGMPYKEVVSVLGPPNLAWVVVGVDSFLGLPIGVDRGIALGYYNYLNGKALYQEGGQRYTIEAVRSRSI